MSAHLAQGVTVFMVADVWWWREEKEEYDEGGWYMLTAIHGLYETASDACKCARKEE